MVKPRSCQVWRVLHKNIEPSQKEGCIYPLFQPTFFRELLPQESNMDVCKMDWKSTNSLWKAIIFRLPVDYRVVQIMNPIPHRLEVFTKRMSFNKRMARSTLIPQWAKRRQKFLLEKWQCQFFSWEFRRNVVVCCLLILFILLMIWCGCVCFDWCALLITVLGSQWDGKALYMQCMKDFRMGSMYSVYLPTM